MKKPQSLTRNDDGNEAASETPVTDDQGSSPENAATTNAEENEEKSLLDAAFDAIAPKDASDEEPDASELEGDADEGDDGTEGSADEADANTETGAAENAESDHGLSDEDLANLPKRTAKRMRQLLADRKSARTERDEATAQLDALRPKAENFDQIERYMREHELSPEEVSQGFEVMRLIKHDPVRALEALTPYVTQLTTLTGGGPLSADLQRQVDEGFVTEAHARQLQQANSRAALATQAAERQAEAMNRRDEAQSAADLQQQRIAAWQNWAVLQKQSDPDFAKIESFVVNQVRAMLHQGAPRSLDQLTSLFDKAKADVIKQLAPYAKPKTEVTPTRSTQSAKPATPAAAEPKTYLDAAYQALGQR